MPYSKMNVFEIVLLIVGVGAAILGFQLINTTYKAENSQVSWMLILSVFNWLSLIVLFILLSLIVDTTKRELGKLDIIIYLLSHNRKKK